MANVSFCEGLGRSSLVNVDVDVDVNVNVNVNASLL